MIITVLENIDFLPASCIKHISDYGEVTFAEKDTPIAEDTDLIITKRTKINEQMLEKLPNLKYIITLTIGTSHITPKTHEMGITIFNCPTYNTHAVVEHTLALIFAASRNILQSNSRLLQNKWKTNPDEFQGYEIQNKNIVVIGDGHIGHEVAKMAKKLGMHVISITSKTSHSAFIDAVSKADYITIHVPLTEKTNRLIDANVIGLLKKNVIIINTSKNEIIDTHALYRALAENRIYGCALDVFENDVSKGDLNPDIKALITLPNVTATPHIAFNTFEANRRLGEELLAHLKSIVQQ